MDYLESALERYLKAGKKGKGRILDELCKVCGYNRKYIIWRLREDRFQRKPKQVVRRRERLSRDKKRRIIYFPTRSAPVFVLDRTRLLTLKPMGRRRLRIYIQRIYSSANKKFGKKGLSRLLKNGKIDKLRIEKEEIMKRWFHKREIIIVSTFLVLFPGFGLFSSAAAVEKEVKYLAITGARLIDGTGVPPLNNAVIVIANDRIVDCGKKGEVKIPDGAAIIDVKGKTVVPGLVDAHVHFTYPPKEEEFFFINEAISAFRAAHFLRQMLMIGVTTVRDVSCFGRTGYQARKAFNLGLFEGSRPIVTGPGVTCTGGHGTEGYRLGIVEEADGPDGFRQAIRQRVKDGADLIKILPPYSREEIFAAVEEAHFHEKFVTVHSGVYKAQYDFVRWAVEAGADCIEHAYALPDDVISQMAAKKIYCVPTLSILLKLGNHYKEKGPEWEWKIKKYLECREIFRKMRAAGVKMAVGTDAVGENMVVYPHFYFEEVENFVALGASAMEAIVAATKIGAEVCAAADRLGTIERGKIADLVVLAGDPLKDIKHLRTAQLIIQAGRPIEIGDADIFLPK